MLYPNKHELFVSLPCSHRLLSTYALPFGCVMRKKQDGTIEWHFPERELTWSESELRQFIERLETIKAAHATGAGWMVLMFAMFCVYTLLIHKS